MTNRQILERIMGDLNELIDVRGNEHLTPILEDVRQMHSEVVGLEMMVVWMRRTSDDE